MFVPYVRSNDEAKDGCTGATASPIGSFTEGSMLPLTSEPAEPAA